MCQELRLHNDKRLKFTSQYSYCSLFSNTYNIHCHYLIVKCVSQLIINIVVKILHGLDSEVTRTKGTMQSMCNSNYFRSYPYTSSRSPTHEKKGAGIKWYSLSLIRGQHKITFQLKAFPTVELKRQSSIVHTAPGLQLEEVGQQDMT